MNRRQTLAAFALAIVAAVTGWMLLTEHEAMEPDRFEGPSRPSYELIDFSLDAYDTDGRRSFRAEAPRLLYDDRVRGLSVSSPVFLLFGANGDQWRVQSKEAWIDTDAKRIELDGAVTIRRAEDDSSRAWSLATERLVADIETRRIETDRAVELRRPGSILRGLGLSADLDAKTFELKANVHGQFVPGR